MDQAFNAVEHIDVRTINGLIGFLVMVLLYASYVLTREILNYKRMKIAGMEGRTVAQFIEKQNEMNAMVSNFLATIANKYSNISSRNAIETVVETLFDYVAFICIDFVNGVLDKNHVFENQDLVREKIHGEMSNYIDYIIRKLDNYKLKGNIPASSLISRDECIINLISICNTIIFDKRCHEDRRIIQDIIRRQVEKQANEVYKKLNQIYDGSN